MITHHKHMRRGPLILTLCILMLASGLVLLATGPGLDIVPLAAILLFLSSAAVALAGMILLYRACNTLTRTLGHHQETGLQRIESPHPHLGLLVESINQIGREAGHAVSRAQLHLKELEIRLKVVTAERRHAEAIIHSISDAVLVTDPFDEVILANDSAARTFNFELPATRAPIEQVLHDPAMVSLIREMRQSNSRSGRRIVEHQVPGPSGARTYKVTLSCLAGQEESSADRGQPAAGVVAVLHDMTREREVGQMKNDFVSNVSHELRTPLASIKAYAEMLIDGETPDEKTRREFYEVIQNEANRLGRLIDNILNISRIESGIVKVNKQPLSLMVILKEAVEVLAPQARQKRITIEERISPAFYQTLADRDMIYEATLNLLSNAVKYTPESGRVTIETLVDESKRIVTTRISDTGVGIPPKDLPYVFDKFYRSEANNRMAKGTGLGLSLVKHIIETVHHGRLFVESQVGQGSTFGFELDLIE